VQTVDCIIEICPNVAIITRTKNRLILLKRAIEAVLSQTEQNWVHVIVNDGGDIEELNTFLSGYCDRYKNRLKIVHNKLSMGMEAASNVGIRASSSKYICILDDDDSWHPQFLERMIAALRSEKWPDTKGIFCHTTIVKEKIKGECVVEIERRDFNQWITAIDLFELFAWNRFVPVSFLFERAVLDKIGYFDETLPVCGDWEFNIRFLSSFEIAVLPENLAFWHQRPDSAGAYANSIFDGRADHKIYRARLINRWVRSSLKQGTLGFGNLFGFSLAGELHHDVRRLEAKMNYVSPNVLQRAWRTVVRPLRRRR
jgi:glycosyltransferase involved in cell wall biosynthesis